MELKPNAGGEKLIVAEFPLPALRFVTTSATFEDDLRYWLHEYFTNGLLLLPRARFESTDKGLLVTDFDLGSLMATHVQVDAEARENRKLSLQSAEKSAKLDLT